MASDDIDDLLETQGYGILSMCGDGEPYSIPVSFGYDGECIYFGFLKQGDDSAKVAHISDGATVRPLITDSRAGSTHRASRSRGRAGGFTGRTMTGGGSARR